MRMFTAANAGWKRFRSKGLVILLGAALLQACGGGGGDSAPTEPDPNTGNPGNPVVAVPSIATQPAIQSVREGQTATFTVTASGGVPLSYQWQRDGADITGATSSTYAFGNAQLADAQSAWRVRVSNSAGTVMSQIATVNVSLAIGDTLDSVESPARFTSITGLAADAQGNIYVSTGYAVRKITAAGAVTTLAGPDNLIVGDPGSPYVDGPGTVARFLRLRGIAVDAAGSVYVADEGNHAVRKISPQGVVTTLVGGPDKAGRVDGPLAGARLDAPVALTIDAAGNLYVLDAISTGRGGVHCLRDSPGGGGDIYPYRDFAVRKITPAGQVSTVAGSSLPSEGLGGSLAVDGQGNIYHSVANVEISGPVFLGCVQGYYSGLRASYIRRIQSDGTVSVLSGSAAAFPPNVFYATPVDGAATVARFQTALGLAWNGAESLYVADADSQAIRRVNIASGAVSTVVGRFPVPGSTLSGAIETGALPGHLLYTDSIAVAPSGTLVLASGDTRGRVLLKTSRKIGP